MNRLKFKDFSKISHHIRGIYRIYLKSMKINRKIATWNRSDIGNTRIAAGYAQNSPSMFKNKVFDALQTRFGPSKHNPKLKT
jgi:hypothetical protein